jgi:hypothetical protein
MLFFDFLNLLPDLILGGAEFLLKSSYKFLILPGDGGELIVHYFAPMVHRFPSALLLLSFNSIPVDSASSFSFKCS